MRGNNANRGRMGGAGRGGGSSNNTNYRGRPLRRSSGPPGIGEDAKQSTPAGNHYGRRKEPLNLPALEIAGHNPNAPKEKQNGADPNAQDQEPAFWTEDRQYKNFNASMKALGEKGFNQPMSNSGVVPRNNLVSKFENESTSHFAAEWRTRPEIPTSTELLRANIELPTNRVKGKFDSVDEYLETHYELLREDAFSGLRDAVGFIREVPDSNDTSDVSIYENVRLLGITYAPMGVCCKFSFSLNRAGKRIRWTNSKRLLPGTLVCLSDDGFETIKVATVAARPLVGVMEMNPPEIDLLFSSQDVEIDTSKVMIMVESRQSYFEAYKWTLKALQRMTKENFPLYEHICFVDKAVPPPEYIKSKPHFNLSCIYPDETDKEILDQVDIVDAWPKNAVTSMDESQQNALKSILTQRLAIVQGPPGTGKTFISVLALRALLSNMTPDDPPIIVACQTNHALDQILKHVMEYEENIVRLGARTQDRDKIYARTISNLRSSYTGLRIQGSGMRRFRGQMDGLRSKMSGVLGPLRSDLLSPEIFSDFGLITKEQALSFEEGGADWVRFEDETEPKDFIAHWLGDSVVPIVHEEDSPLDYEEADIELDEILQMEADFFSGGNNDQEENRDGLSGLYTSMGRHFQVEEPLGVTQEEIKKASQVKNVWELPSHVRAALYCHLERQAKKKIFENYKALNTDYHNCVKQVKIAKMEKDAYILSSSKLVGTTTTGLSKYRSLVAAVQPKIVLIEEAAETLEGPVTVACMPSVEHLILVGDHLQLRGHCAVKELQTEPYFLDISMFERLIGNEMPHGFLSAQRRMRPEIREVVNPIYKGQLTDHPTVLSRALIQGMGSINVFWCSHTNHEDQQDTSKVNYHEADMIVNFINYLILNGTPAEDITVLTFYTGQRIEIIRRLRRHEKLKLAKVRVATVDSYQGEENEIVILSLVRSNPGQHIGFLNVANRVCVALSRAKRGFYIFGDAQMITRVDQVWWDVGVVLNKGNPPRIGWQLPLTCHKHKKMIGITGVSDWDETDGGCKAECTELLRCRHKCPLRCHPYDHSEIICKECKPAEDLLDEDDSSNSVIKRGIEPLISNEPPIIPKPAWGARNSKVGFNTYGQRGRAGFEHERERAVNRKPDEQGNYRNQGTTGGSGYYAGPSEFKTASELEKERTRAHSPKQKEKEEALIDLLEAKPPPVWGRR